jgi:hypothetical protein
MATRALCSTPNCGRAASSRKLCKPCLAAADPRFANCIVCKARFQLRTRSNPATTCSVKCRDKARRMTLAMTTARLGPYRQGHQEMSAAEVDAFLAGRDREWLLPKFVKDPQPWTDVVGRKGQ